MQIVTQTQDQADQLIEKQWRARVWMSQNPFARAMNLKVRLYFKGKCDEKATVSAITG